LIVIVGPVKLDTVSKTSRHHKRGGKSKNKIKVKDKSHPLKIDFLNIRGITSKILILTVIAQQNLA
jgi:hypothetical protein